MQARTILAVGITAALLGGSGVAYSDLRDDGSHVHVTNSGLAPVPVDSAARPVATSIDMVASANNAECRILAEQSDPAEVLESVSMYVNSPSRPTVWLRYWFTYKGLNTEVLPVTQGLPGVSWGAHWDGKIPLNIDTRSAANSYDPPKSAGSIVQIDICVKNQSDPITKASGIASFHRLP